MQGQAGGWCCSKFWLQGAFLFRGSNGSLGSQMCSSHTWGSGGDLRCISRGLICHQPHSCLLELGTDFSFSGGLTYSCSDLLCEELMIYLPQWNRIEINFKSLKAVPTLSEIPCTTWKRSDGWGGSFFPLLLLTQVNSLTI